MMTFSINQVRSEKALLEKQEQLLKLREEQLVQVDKRCDNIFSTQLYNSLSFGKSFHSITVSGFPSLTQNKSGIL